MENLYIKTEKGKIPIPENIAQKLNLKKGMLSPFTCNKIVGENDSETAENSYEKPLLNEDPETTENVMLSTSEIIDFSQGMDSHSDES